MIGCLPTYHRKHVHEPLPPAPEADKDSEITVVTENPPAKVEVKKKSRRSKSFFGILSLHGHSDKKTNTEDEGEINPKAAVQQQETGQSPPQTPLVRAASVGHVTEMVQPLSPSPPSIIEVGSACESSTSLSDFISDSIIYNSDGEEEEKEDPKFDADEAIDTKADEFIAQFYKQIEIQNTIPNDSGEFCRRG